MELKKSKYFLTALWLRWVLWCTFNAIFLSLKMQCNCHFSATALLSLSRSPRVKQLYFWPSYAINIFTAFPNSMDVAALHWSLFLHYSLILSLPHSYSFVLLPHSLTSTFMLQMSLSTPHTPTYPCNFFVLVFCRYFPTKSLIHSTFPDQKWDLWSYLQWYLQ